MATQMQFWEVFILLSLLIESHSHFYAETLQQSWDRSNGYLESALSALLECWMQFLFVKDTCWTCCMYCTYLCTKLQDNCDTFLRQNVPHTRLDRSHALSEYLCCRQNNNFFFFLFPFPHFFDFSLSFFAQLRLWRSCNKTLVSFVWLIFFNSIRVFLLLLALAAIKRHCEK